MSGRRRKISFCILTAQCVRLDCFTITTVKIVHRYAASFVHAVHTRAYPHRRVPLAIAVNYCVRDLKMFINHVLYLPRCNNSIIINNAVHINTFQKNIIGTTCNERWTDMRLIIKTSKRVTIPSL
jgi:hypothetical protein